MYKQSVNLPPKKIHYKLIRPEDFPEYIVKDNSYTEIIPDENGYISQFLVENVDLEHKDTTIINASVGEGKTTALIDIATQYASREDYVVFIAAPYISLINQYKNQLKLAGVVDEDIFDYQDLFFETIEDDKENFAKKKFQLVTFNFLLANSGDDYLKQADHKIEYVDELLLQCKSDGRKIIIIFDEVHDAIHNFKEELVFNLFRWRSNIHKIFVSSATFNEASKVVIKYLAELTDQKIHIFESPRIQNVNKLNALNIFIYDRTYYDFEDDAMKEFFALEIGKASKINILSYSKSLCDRFIRSSIGAEIRGKYKPFNVCTNDTPNIFDESLCNIGTTFKTGISIREDNTAFYIFLPSRKSYYSTPPKLGIFSDGINSLIQGLARIRGKGRIYVITPDKTCEFESPSITKPTKSNSYYEINEQDDVLRRFYEMIRLSIDEEIGYLSGENTKIVAQFPDYDHYKLMNGERFFKTYFDIFGRNITNYFSWASNNNQFVNCTLRNIYRIDLNFDEDEILKDIGDYFSKSFQDDYFFQYLSPLEQYHRLRNSIFSNYVTIKSKSGKKIEVKEYEKVVFEKHIIKFIQQINHQMPNVINDLGHNHDTADNILGSMENLRWLEDFKIKALKKHVEVNNKDYMMSTEEYIRSAIFSATNIQYRKSANDEKENNLIILYSKLGQFKEKLVNNYFEKMNNKIIITPDKDFKFNEDDYAELVNLFDGLLKNDIALNKIFTPFKSGKSDKAMYSLLKKIFFITGRTNRNGEKITTIKDEFNSEHPRINLLYEEIDLVRKVKETPSFYQFPDD